LLMMYSMSRFIGVILSMLYLLV